MRRAVLAVAAVALVPVLTPAGSAVQIVGFHNVHLRVADPAAATDWYIKYLGATKAPAPFQIAFGRTLVALVKTDKPEPSEGSVIDHIGLSYSDLKGKMKDFEAGGAKVVTPLADAPGFFTYGFDASAAALKSRGVKVISEPRQAGPVRYAFFEDPNGGRLELVQHARP